MLGKKWFAGTLFFIVLLLAACGGTPTSEEGRGEGTVQVAQAVTGPPTVTSFTPTSALQGASVTINGTQFEATSTVSFNGTPSAAVTFVSSLKVKAVVPPGATTGPISVSNSLGNGASATAFKVLPKILSFS